MRILNTESIRGDARMSKLTSLIFHLLAEVIILQEIDNGESIHYLGHFRIGKAMGVYFFFLSWYHTISKIVLKEAEWGLKRMFGGVYPDVKLLISR